MNNEKKIVVIGGGTGTYNVLRGLKKYSVNLTAIVSMADDGGSTGKLRDEHGILPPGDVRRCLIALSESRELMKELFAHRFDKGTLTGHSFGNLFLTALTETLGDDGLAIKEASSILNIKGSVLPVTLDNTRLVAELANGQIIKGETNIDVPKHDPKNKIKKVFLKPEAKINTDAQEAIKNADLIIIGPGDLYTSLIPNLLVRGMPESIKQTRAKKVYVSNLMTKHGETDDYSLSQFVKTIEEYLGKNVLNTVLYGQNEYIKELLEEYEEENAYPVRHDEEEIKKLEEKGIRFVKGSFTTGKNLIRHDPEKLAKEIMKL